MNETVLAYLVATAAVKAAADEAGKATRRHQRKRETMNSVNTIYPVNGQVARVDECDNLEVLEARGNLRLAKLWGLDGTIAGYGDAKLFKRTPQRVRNIRELSTMLRRLEGQPGSAIVRGRYRGDGALHTDVGLTDDERATAQRAGYVRKALHYFEDQPLHTLLVDVDKFEPLTCDPVLEPDEAVAEFIATHLPSEFQGAAYHAQLSGSAGHPSKPGLRAHIWFWLHEPLTSAQLKAWATATGAPVDKALFHPVQWHYTANPVFEAGVADPVPVRSGFVDGGDVHLVIDEQMRAARPASAVALTKLRSMADSCDPYVEKLVALGLVVEEFPHGLGVRCPNEPHQSGESGSSQAVYFPIGVGGRTAPGFKCQHDQCRDTLNGASFLLLTGADDPADDFRDVTPLTRAQIEEGAAAAIRNAKRSSGVLETEAERSARIGREGTHAAPTQRVMSGSEMLEELVYIAEGARVSFVDEPRYALPFTEFKSLTAGSLDKVQGKGKLHRAQRWLESPERKTVRTQTFAPGRSTMCMSPDNVLAQNLWLPRDEVAPEYWRELVQPFFDHVAYLVPNAEERGRFLDWLAHIEQAPGVLPSTHYLLVAKQTGIGRNWLAYALARAFAGHTALGFDLGEALRSGFNGALSQKLLAVVDELHEGGPGGMGKPIAEKLKSMLTEATRRVNPKFGRQHVEFNCCRFLMFSNHESALPLAENDRRVVVIENPATRRDGDYYSRLYALLDEPGLGAALAAAFRERDISGFNPGEVAPMSAAKARTIRAGRSEVEQAVRDVANEWPSACITSGRLQHAVSEALGGGKSWSAQGACVAAGLVKYAGRVKVAGIPAHVWLLREQRRWSGVAPAEVAAEVLRGEAETNGSEFA